MNVLGLRTAGRVGRMRLASLGIEPAAYGTSAMDVVRRAGAMQAQDLDGVLWSLGLRTGLTQAAVEQAIADRHLVRTWPMRGTLHLVPAQDARWMCALLAGPSIRAAERMRAHLGIEEQHLATAVDTLTAALTGGAVLTRAAAVEALGRAGLDTSGQRGYHYLVRLAQAGLICQGPREGKQQTFVALDAWVPQHVEPSREEAMARLADRYVASHGPVTERDFAGWCGQNLGFAREAIALAGSAIVRERRDDVEYLVHADAPTDVTLSRAVHLLPGFDEFMLGYKDRSAVITREHEAIVVPGRNGVFSRTVVTGGRVVGRWRSVVRRGSLGVQVRPFPDLPDVLAGATAARALERAARAHARFHGVEFDAVEIVR